MNSTNVLAIDTSTQYLSLALQSKMGRSYILEEVGNKQAESILGKIKELLLKHNLAVEELNIIAYNEGPGSFTGLRIGLSIAKGIAFGLNIPLVAVPAFAIFAVNFKLQANGSNALVGLDARLRQIYLAGINTTTLDYFLLPQIIDPDKIDYISATPLIGNGFTNYFSLLNSSLQEVVLKNKDWSNFNATAITNYPNALNMLDIVQLDKYSKLDALSADLCYLRNKIALDVVEQQQARESNLPRMNEKAKIHKLND